MKSDGKDSTADDYYVWNKIIFKTNISLVYNWSLSRRKNRASIPFPSHAQGT